MIISLLILVIFAGCQLAASWSDVSSMKIRNWVSVALFLGFLAVTPFVWQGWHTFGVHMQVGGACFALGLVGFAVGGMGGGDAKLFAATSFWWVWDDLIIYVFCTTIAGGVFAIALLLSRKFIPVTEKTTIPWFYRLMKDKKDMPYGLALAFGALFTLPYSDIYQFATNMAKIS